MQLIPQRILIATQTANVLRAGLKKGIWRGELPGERSLCERLSVSRPTLRTALEQLTREGWLEVSQGRARRILRPGSERRPARTEAVGLLTPVGLHAVPPFVLSWIDELREHLGRNGQPLEVQVVPGCFVQRPVKALESLVRRAPACVRVLYQATEPMQRWFEQNDVPCVLAGSSFPGVTLPSVDIDYRAACLHATNLLLAKGHRRIALVARGQPLGGDVESELGFREAFAKLRTQSAQPIFLRHNDTIHGLCAQLDKLFRARGTAPTALLVARTHHALTAVTQLLRRGWKVPEEVAVISRDDDAFLDYAVPSLARYRSDATQFARRVERIVQQLKAGGKIARPQVRLMPRFIKGESVR